MRTAKGGNPFPNKRPRPVETSSDDEPISKLPIKQARPEPSTIDLVNTGGFEASQVSVELTCKSTTAKKAVESFARYVDQIMMSREEAVAKAVANEKDLRDMSKKYDEIVKAASECAKCNKEKDEAFARVLKERDAKYKEVSDLANSYRQRALAAEASVKDIAKVRDLEQQLQEKQNRIVQLEDTIDSTTNCFYDVIALDSAVCPILLTNGKVLGFEQVINYWLHSDCFDGKPTSMFTCPLTRQLTRVHDLPAIQFVVGIAEQLGLDLDMPFSFEFDANPIPENPDNVESEREWVTYNIEAQLNIFAAVVSLYRDRQFGLNSKIVQTNNNHTIQINMGAMTETATGLHTYKIEMGLTVITDMVPNAHRIQYVKRPSVPNHLQEFMI